MLVAQPRAPQPSDFGNGGDRSPIYENTLTGELFYFNDGKILPITTNASLAAPTGSSLVGFIQGGVGTVLSTVQDRLRDTISVKDFGAKGDGITDDTAAIQAAIDYVQTLANRPTIYFPVGKYITTSTLIITGDNVSLVGLGSPSLGRGDESGETTRGATIRYRGTGIAVKIGVAPGVSGTFINNIVIENIRIEVDDNTQCALYVWMPADSYFFNIPIFGNQGAGNYGLQVLGSIQTIFEKIDIFGLGQNYGFSPANYLGAGFFGDVGYNFSPATTTVFRRCYFHYCNRGVQMNYIYDFEDCMFEANNTGVESISYMVSNFTRCWWEANVTLDMYFTGGYGGDTVNIYGGRIDAYARQTFLGFNTVVHRLALRDVMFTTTHASPLIASSGTITSGGFIVMSGCTLPANCKFGGALGAGSTFPAVSVIDQKLTIYRFKQTTIAAGAAYNPVPTESAIAGGAYTMPMAGNIVGVNLYYSSAMGAGTFNIATLLNGGTVADYSQPIQPAFSSVPQNRTKDPLTNAVAQGDLLSVALSTSGTFATTGGDFIYEVMVAHGPNGL